MLRAVQGRAFHQGRRLRNLQRLARLAEERLDPRHKPRQAFVAEPHLRLQGLVLADMRGVWHRADSQQLPHRPQRQNHSH